MASTLVWLFWVCCFAVFCSFWSRKKLRGPIEWMILLYAASSERIVLNFMILFVFDISYFIFCCSFRWLVSSSHHWEIHPIPCNKKIKLTIGIRSKLMFCLWVKMRFLKCFVSGQNFRFFSLLLQHSRNKRAQLISNEAQVNSFNC